MRNKLSKDNMELLNNFIEKRIKESYIKYYNGKVIDNEDSDKLGRCRIRVFGVYGIDIPDEDIPWALPDFSFIGSTLGSFVVPPVDAIVKVYFDDKNIYTPKYTTKIMDSNNLPSDLNEDYPHTMIFFETDEGEYFKINRKTNETTYHTASGATFVITSDGNLEIDLQGCDTGNVTITDKSANTLTMDSTGVKINDKFLVNEDFLQWMIDNISKLGLGNLGAPVPIFPAAATSLVTGVQIPENFKTDKL